MLSFFVYIGVSAQDIGEPEMQNVTNREWSLDAFLTTIGGGIGFSYQRTPDYNNKHGFEVNLLYNYHPKAVLAKNYSQEFAQYAKAYSFGKLCDLLFLRTGYIYHRILNHKPYWGGVEVGLDLSFGASLAIAIPVYVNYFHIIDPATGTGTFWTDRYDPSNPEHTQYLIVSRANIFRGMKNIFFRPGFYGKIGFQFDFSKNYMKIQALTVGVFADVVFPNVQQMAYNKAKTVFFGAYLGYRFGKKKGIYE
jgi:hypothetical protein